MNQNDWSEEIPALEDINGGRLLIKVRHMGDCGVAPKFFEIVALAHLRKEYMYPRIAVIKYYPVAHGVAVNGVWLHTRVFEYIFGHALGDGGCLGC